MMRYNDDIYMIHILSNTFKQTCDSGSYLQFELLIDN